MVSSLSGTQGLKWLERLLEARPAESAGALPRSQFYCRLDDQVDHLTPAHGLRSYTQREGPDRTLFLNPDCRFTRGRELPEDAAGEGGPPERFALPHPLVWVRDPGSEALLPFWLGEELRALLAEVRPGQHAPVGLPPEMKRILAMAGVLVPQDWSATRRHEWIAANARAAQTFRQKGYVPVPNLLHPFHVGALRRYYRHMVRTGGMTDDVLQSPGRVIVHNESVARFFHHQLTASVAALVGEPVKPSYVYVACYQPGAMLKKHVDREQCEFSITLCLDYSPEPRTSTPWPLQLDTPSGKSMVFQALGDGLLYRGRQLPHFRDPLPMAHTSTSIFFHYVRQDFRGRLE
jgi:hypothetical protein